MQDLYEGVFINMANLTLTRRDSYMAYLRAGIKLDTLTALRNSLLYMSSPFPDYLLAKVEDKIFHHEQKHSANISPKKPTHFHSYSQSGKQAQDADWMSDIPAWKQLTEQERARKGLQLPTGTGQRSKFI